MMAAYLVERGSPFGLEHNPRASGETPHRLPHERNCVSHAEEIEYLLAELEDSRRRTRLAKLRGAFNLTAQEARMVMALFRANGRTLSPEYLEEAMERDRTGGCSTTTVYITKVRRKMGYDTIGNAPTLGYHITESGLERVRNALGPDQRSNPAQLKER